MALWGAECWHSTLGWGPWNGVAPWGDGSSWAPLWGGATSTQQGSPSPWGWTGALGTLGLRDTGDSGWAQGTLGTLGLGDTGNSGWAQGALGTLGAWAGGHWSHWDWGREYWGHRGHRAGRQWGHWSPWDGFVGFPCLCGAAWHWSALGRTGCHLVALGCPGPHCRTVVLGTPRPSPRPRPSAPRSPIGPLLRGVPRAPPPRPSLLPLGTALASKFVTAGRAGVGRGSVGSVLSHW